MAAHTSQCSVCSRSFTYYDAAPTYFCSVGCEVDAGPVGSQIRAVSVERGRAARVSRAVMDVESAVPQSSLGKEDK